MNELADTPSNNAIDPETLIQDERPPNLKPQVLDELACLRGRDLKALVIMLAGRVLKPAKMDRLITRLGDHDDLIPIIRSLDALENAAALLRGIRALDPPALTRLLDASLGFRAVIGTLQSTDVYEAPVNKLDQLAQGPCSEEIFQLLLSSDDPFALGLLASFSLTPDQAARLAAPASAIEMTLVHIENGWILCNQAEPYLIRSLDHDACVLVNDTLLVKFCGRLTAICLKNSSNTRSQSLLAGHWYSPTWGPTRDPIKQAFLNGQFRVTLPESSWQYFRPAYSEHRHRSPVSSLAARELLLARASRFVSTHPDQLSDRPDGLTRAEYLAAHTS